MHEEQTAAELADCLKALGYGVTTSVGGPGIVAVLRNGNGPTVLLRTEMDAHPIEGQMGLPYASQVIVKTSRSSTSPGCPLLIFWVGAVDPVKYATALKSGTDPPQLHSSTWNPDYMPSLKNGGDGRNDGTAGIAGTLK